MKMLAAASAAISLHRDENWTEKLCLEVTCHRVDTVTRLQLSTIREKFLTGRNIPLSMLESSLARDDRYARFVIPFDWRASWNHVLCPTP